MDDTRCCDLVRLRWRFEQLLRSQFGELLGPELALLEGEGGLGRLSEALAE